MFVRTMLAVSLGCIFAGQVFAASTAEQPLKPQVVTDVAVQDPIDPLATEASAAPAEAQITAQEQQDLKQASEALNELQDTEDQTASVGAAPNTKAPTNSAMTKASWTLDGLNNAQW
ncbi:MAG: murein L,D-transpeptidase, partial [Acinetobacter sp.]